MLYTLIYLNITCENYFQDGYFAGNYIMYVKY